MILNELVVNTFNCLFYVALNIPHKVVFYQIAYDTIYSFFFRFLDVLCLFFSLPFFLGFFVKTRKCGDEKVLN